MLPLVLDLTLLPTALVGGGAPLVKRLAILDGDDVLPIRIFAPAPDAHIRSQAGDRLIERLPSEAEIGEIRVLFLAGLESTATESLARLARARGVLVNAEDQPEFCDFHVPAIVHRGDLQISVSTGGKSPTLARRLRAYIETLFPDSWTDRTRRAAELRLMLRDQGASPAEIIEATDALADSEAWFERPAPD